MSILVDKNTRVVVQGITGATGQFHTQRVPASTARRSSRGVTPGKGGTDFEGIPIFDTVAQAVKATGANASRDLRAAAVRGRRDPGGGRRGHRARRLHHRGHPGRSTWSA